MDIRVPQEPAASPSGEPMQIFPGQTQVAFWLSRGEVNNPFLPLSVSVSPAGMGTPVFLLESSVPSAAVALKFLTMICLPTLPHPVLVTVSL